jgi:opacity protein-like surface antigen
MRRQTATLTAALAAAACAAAGAAAASDFNPAGIYVGAGIGQSNVRNDGYYSSDYYDFNRRETAWQLTAGVRPIAPLGLEYDYIRFGSPNGYYGAFYNNGDNTNAHALFAVGYLPLPLPLVDVYAKLGVARLQSSTTVYGPFDPLYVSSTNTDFAYGIGAQVKFSNIAVRAEYERVSDHGGNPDLLAVGVTWTF